MAKTKISEYDSTAGNNTDVNSVNINEGCAPSGINNAIREVMAALKRFQTGADGDSVTVGGNLVVSGSATMATTAISSADINAGTIDGTTIGGSTPAAGTFTTLASTGNTTLGDASGDSVTINASTVSTPNGLNFDSNTLVIDATNNRVGINVGSPTVSLQVTKAALTGFVSRTQATATLENSGDTELYIASGASSIGQLRFGDTGSNFRGAISYDHLSDGFLFYTAGSERMRIDSSGNVGIGTSSATYKLEVVSTGNDVLKLSGGASATLMQFNASSTDDYAFGTVTSLAGIGIKNLTDDRYDFFINDSGNVGIGTTSPVEKLTVTGSISLSSDLVLKESTTARGYIFGNSTGLNIRAASGLAHVFDQAGTERMRIDSSGNLLVGKTASGVAIVGAELNSNGILRIARSGAAPIEANRTTSDGTIVDLRKDNTTVGTIASQSGPILAYLGSSYATTGAGDVGLFFSPDNDHILPVTATTSATRDNAISLGSAAGRFKDLYLSGGVYVGGTGSANYLDDYEEGTWTVTATPSTSGSITLSSSRNIGSYTKVGRMVTVMAGVDVLSVSSPVGKININLPFTPVSGSQRDGWGAPSIMVNNTTSSGLNTFVALLEQTSNVIGIYLGTGTSVSSTSAQQMTSGTEIFFTLTYKTST